MNKPHYYAVILRSLLEHHEEPKSIIVQATCPRSAGHSHQVRTVANRYIDEVRRVLPDHLLPGEIIPMEAVVYVKEEGSDPMYQYLIVRPITDYSPKEEHNTPILGSTMYLVKVPVRDCIKKRRTISWVEGATGTICKEYSHLPITRNTIKRFINNLLKLTQP